jgi:hypothetical protein
MKLNNLMNQIMFLQNVLENILEVKNFLYLLNDDDEEYKVILILFCVLR